MIRLRNVGLILTLAFVASLSFAAPKAVNNQDLLIKKLKRVLTQIRGSDSSRTAITLRLADLLAERARVNSMKELEGNCSDCVAGVKDREASIEYYENILPKLDREQASRVMAQMGHLYELLGQTQKAETFYKKILNSNIDKGAKADAYLSLAEMSFRRNNFSQAAVYYNKMLALGSQGRRGLATYRLSWSYFRMGQVGNATGLLVKMLNDPKLLTRAADSNIPSEDLQFKGEVSRDLATFYAQSKPTMKEAKFLYEVSPVETKISNVSYLATELDRLGKMKESLAIWEYVREKLEQPKDKFQAALDLSTIKFKLGQHEKSLRDYKISLGIWRDNFSQCTEDPCPEWKTRLRNYVIYWNKQEKSKASSLLVEAYHAFLKINPNDMEMRMYLAQALRKNNDYTASYAVYKEAHQMSSQAGLQASLMKTGMNPEKLLLVMLELAELSKSEELTTATYDYYLEHSKDRSQVAEVRYQKAYHHYKKEEYQQSADAFRKLVANQKADGKLRNKSADLALDSLVVLKNENLLTEWATEFANLLPKRKAEFQTLVRKSLLNRAVNVAKADDQKGLEASWAILNQVNLGGSTDAEKLAYYKNKLKLAESLKRTTDAKMAADALLALPKLNVTDKEYANSRKAYYAELTLDFQTAFQTYQKLGVKTIAAKDKALKLAILTDLQKKDSAKLYTDYLKFEKDAKTREGIATRLVRESKNKYASWLKYKKDLMNNPALWTRIGLEIYAEDDKKPIWNHFVKAKQDKDPSASVIWKRGFFKEYETYKAKVSSHQMSSGNQRTLRKTLKQRHTLLKDGEKVLAKAIERGDWTSQMIVVSLLAKENDRFYQDIFSLPIPDGLDEQQQGEYMGLLSQQASPHQLRSQEMKNKWNDFWAQPEAVVEKIKKALSEEDNPKITKLIKEELNYISAEAPDKAKELIAGVVNQPAKKTQEKTASSKVKENWMKREKLTAKVRQNPFDLDSLQNLIDTESEVGNQAMAEYLKGRLTSLSSNKGDLL